MRYGDKVTKSISYDAKPEVISNTLMRDFNFSNLIETHYSKYQSTIGNEYKILLRNVDFLLKNLTIEEDNLKGGKEGTDPNITFEMGRNAENKQFFDPIPSDMMFLASN